MLSTERLVLDALAKIMGPGRRFDASTMLTELGFHNVAMRMLFCRELYEDGDVILDESDVASCVTVEDVMDLVDTVLDEDDDGDDEYDDDEYDDEDEDEDE